MMILKDQNILFFTRTMRLGGTENVVLQLCEIFKPLVNNIVVCSCGGVNVEKLDMMGIQHYEIPDIETKSFKTIFKTMKVLKKIVKNEKITIIHTHHRMAAFYVSILKLYKKCKFYNTSHNTFMDKKMLTNYVYKNAGLIACGEMVKKNLVQFYGIPQEKVTVIHNAVKKFDEDVIVDSLIKDEKEQGHFIVGNVGRLSEQKGMEYFIKSIPLVICHHENVRFFIVGTGEDEHKLRKMIKDMDISRYVHFMGYRSDVQNLMSQMDLVVLSSLWEGFPLTPIEAFSVGKSIVATAVDGTIEIVKDGINGLLVRPKDYKDLAEKINYMIEIDERCKMEERAKMCFEDEFSFEKLAEKYIGYYKERVDG